MEDKEGGWGGRYTAMAFGRCRLKHRGGAAAEPLSEFGGGSEDQSGNLAVRSLCCSWGRPASRRNDNFGFLQCFWALGGQQRLQLRYVLKNTGALICR